MTKRVGIVICYFGVLPSTFDVWIKSCEYNSNFDYFVFTDQDMDCNGGNVHVYKTSLDLLKKRIEDKLQLDNVSLGSAYKLCDFKPMYGVIFDDYLVGYDFWGMCDMDMIFGDLESFLSDEIFDSYDKIYQLGHFTLYRNTKEVNERFKLKGYCDWAYAATRKENCRLCERGMMTKYRNAQLSVYAPRDYADISKLHKRYQLSHWLVPYEHRDYIKHQLFYYDNGHVYRAYLDNGRVIVQEFNYIHIQKRVIEVSEDIGESFYITQDKLINKQVGIPSAEDICRLNPYRGRLVEIIECIMYELRTRNLLKRYVSRIKVKGR